MQIKRKVLTMQRVSLVLEPQLGQAEGILSEETSSGEKPDEETCGQGPDGETCGDEPVEDGTEQVEEEASFQQRGG